MSVQATSTEETKKDVPPQPDSDAKKVEEDAPSSPAAEPGKKKRKLNDGSSSKADESTGFFSSLGNFLSGSWFWPSSMPANVANTTADAAAKAQDKKAEGEKPSEPTKAEEDSTEEGSLKPSASKEKTTDDAEGSAKPATANEKDTEEKAPKDSTDDSSNKDDAKEPKKTPQKNKGARAISVSPKAVVTTPGSRKRRRLS
jgi:hypothetical protein